MKFNYLYIFVLFPLSCFSQQKIFPVPQIEFNPKNYVCYQSPQKIIIDGSIDEDAWNSADWTEKFTDIEGNLKPDPYHITRAKMLWDDEYFYFAAELEEDNIWATLRERDTVIFYDNDFEIFIDPDGDTHYYYELEMNAFNTVWDLLLIKPYRDIKNAAVTDWDIKGLKTAVKINGTNNDPSDQDESWTIEAAIPWKTFSELSEVNLPPKDGDTWRVNFSRVQWETEIVNGTYRKKLDHVSNKLMPEHNWTWSPQGLIAMHYPEMWGYVQFSEKSAGVEKVKFIPDPAEIVKWELRKIYYAQKNYYLMSNKYASSIDVLKNYKSPEDLNISIESTSFGYKASAEFNGKQYVIYDDGKIVSVSNEE